MDCLDLGPEDKAERPPKLKLMDSSSLTSDDTTMAILSASDTRTLDLLPLDKSYEITPEGTFIDMRKGFEINQRGLKTPPRIPLAERRSLTGDENKSRPASREDASPRVFNLSAADLIEAGTLGRGATGTVKKCFHVPSLTFIALKCIDVFEKSKRHQLIKELEALTPQEGETQCPYTVAFLGAYFDSGSSNLALEFMNRGSLQQVIDTYGPLNEAVLASVAKQVLLGLQVLHKRYAVHRDIKPANILVNLHGAVKITDFGILAELASTVNQCKTFVGTAVYMSPERIQSKPYDFSADVWSLGMTLITCALGKYPLSTDKGYFGLASLIVDNPAPELPADKFSAACRSFISLCLQKDPSKRPTVAVLLKQPFVASVDVNVRAPWPFEAKGGPRELAELDMILKFLIEQNYAAGRTTYTRSLAALSRFQKIGSQLGFPPEAIERRLLELMPAGPT